MKRIVPIIGAALLLVSCTSPERAAQPSEETTQPPLGAVSSIDDLRTAYTDAGGTCGAITKRGHMPKATDSAECDDGAVILSIYLDHDSAVEVADELMTLLKPIGGEVIIGENWLINPGSSGDDAATIAKKLGGQHVKVEAAS